MEELDTAATPGSAPGTQDAPQAARADSAPATPAAGTTATPGSEPTAAEPQDPGKEHQKLRRRAQQAEAEAAYYRGLAEGRAAGAPLPGTTPTAEGPPAEEAFENYEDFLVAKARYEVRQEEQQNRAREAARTRESSWNARLSAAAAEDPELLDAVNDPSLPISAAMAEAIKESELGPKVLRHLADHPEEAAKIARLGPIAAAREIGRLEHALGSAKAEVKKVSGAPTPIPTVTGASAGSDVVDEDKLSTAEWMARENARAIEARFGKRV